MKPTSGSSSIITAKRKVSVLVKTCNYCDTCLDSVLRDRIVIGIIDSVTRQELVKIRKLTFAQCVDMCRAAEGADMRNKVLKPDKVYQLSVTDKSRTAKRKCKFCELMHMLWKELCPAYGQKCNKCNEANHLASEFPEFLRVPRVHKFDEESISFSEEELISMVKAGADSKVINCRMIVGSKDVVFQVDPSATANLLLLQYADSVKPDARVLKM